jgi:DNA topoisomerase-1
MSKILVIVESPGKIHKIEAILGSKYKVMASYGHIIDLAEGSMSIDLKNSNFEPEYSVIKPNKNSKFKAARTKAEIIKDIKKEASKSSDILLATDEDREGEMIAWSLAYVLNIKDPKRIVFNSITKNELLAAIKSPGKINQDMVDAQKTRRILDRIVGYELSPILWKHVGAKLSAGRVQSVVARLIVDKEKEIKDFYLSGVGSYFKCVGTFLDTKKQSFNAMLYKDKKYVTKQDTEIEEETIGQKKQIKQDEEDEDSDGTEKFGLKARIPDESSARNLIKLMSKSTYTINDIIEKEKIRNPSAPFTTSSIQQEASRKLGFNVKRTMMAAQNLYEGGYITYMRTDSMNLSKEAVENIEKYVLEKFGKKYYRHKEYKTKKQNTQEAHEAIRPTDVFETEVKTGGKIGSDEFKLYNLIWKRTLASQMVPAIINVKNIQILISKVKEYYFLTQIENIKFDGFLAIYNLTNIDAEQEDQEADTETNFGLSVPPKGKEIKVSDVAMTQEYQKPPSRYNEASLVNKLDPKNLNIGRPSTYATIIEKILEKKYVQIKDIFGEEKDSLLLEWKNGEQKINENINKITLGKEMNKFVPTSTGILVNDFLIKNFPDIMDYKFTAGMEEKLDDIAESKAKWKKVLEEFYKKFHVVVEKMLAQKTSMKDENARVIGKHPTTGEEIVATLGKFGPMLKMCKNKSNCVYAPIKEPLTMETITLKDALKLFEWPKDLGEYKGESVMLYKGEFGLYLKYKGKNITLSKSEELKDKTDISLKDVTKLIDEVMAKYLWEKLDGKQLYLVLEGPYGKYIQVSNTAIKKKPMNVPLPKDTDLSKLTLEQVKEIINNKFKRKDKEKIDKISKDTKESKDIKDVQSRTKSTKQKKPRKTSKKNTK